MQTKNKIWIAAAAGLALITLGSPMFEEAQDAIVYDAALTKTCYDRHGFNFLGRWSCRSSLRQVGMFAAAMSCGFNKGKKNDFCANLETMSTENNKREREANR